MTASAPRERQRGDVFKALLALAVAVVVIIGLVAVFMAGTSKHDIRGDVTLTDTQHPAALDGTCQGAGGYDDIQGGAEVTVKDEKGKTIGTAVLEPGAGDGTSCVFDFTVKSVPADSSFYAIEVSHRGAVTFSRKQLEGEQWFASLSLGHA